MGFIMDFENPRVGKRDEEDFQGGNTWLSFSCIASIVLSILVEILLQVFKGSHGQNDHTFGRFYT